MNVRVGCIVILVTFLCVSVIGRSAEGRAKTGVNFFNVEDSIQVDEEMWEQLRSKCRLDFLQMAGNFEAYSLYLNEEMFTESGSTKASLQNVINALPPHLKQTLLDCLQKENIPFYVSREEDGSKNWYVRYLESFFGRRDPSRRYLGEKPPLPIPGEKPPLPIPAASVPPIRSPLNVPERSSGVAPASLDKAQVETTSSSKPQVAPGNLKEPSTGPGQPSGLASASLDKAQVETTSLPKPQVAPGSLKEPSTGPGQPSGSASASLDKAKVEPSSLPKPQVAPGSLKEPSTGPGQPPGSASATSDKPQVETTSLSKPQLAPGNLKEPLTVRGPASGSTSAGLNKPQEETTGLFKPQVAPDSFKEPSSPPAPPTGSASVSLDKPQLETASLSKPQVTPGNFKEPLTARGPATGSTSASLDKTQPLPPNTFKPDLGSATLKEPSSAGGPSSGSAPVISDKTQPLPLNTFKPDMGSATFKEPSSALGPSSGSAPAGSDKTQQLPPNTFKFDLGSTTSKEPSSPPAPPSGSTSASLDKAQPETASLFKPPVAPASSDKTQPLPPNTFKPDLGSATFKEPPSALGPSSGLAPANSDKTQPLPPNTFKPDLGAATFKPDLGSATFKEPPSALGPSSGSAPANSDKTQPLPPNTFKPDLGAATFKEPSSALGPSSGSAPASSDKTQPLPPNTFKPDLGSATVKEPSSALGPSSGLAPASSDKTQPLPPNTFKPDLGAATSKEPSSALGPSSGSAPASSDKTQPLSTNTVKPDELGSILGPQQEFLGLYESKDKEKPDKEKPADAPKKQSDTESSKKPSATSQSPETSKKPSTASQSAETSKEPSTGSHPPETSKKPSTGSDSPGTAHPAPHPAPKKRHEMPVSVAIGVTATGAIICALVVLCFYQMRTLRPGYGEKDDYSLQTLRLRSLSFDASRKSTLGGVTDKEKHGSLSSVSSTKQSVKSSSSRHKLSTASDLSSVHEEPLLSENAGAAAPSEELSASSGNPGGPAVPSHLLKPPPGRSNPPPPGPANPSPPPPPGQTNPPPPPGLAKPPAPGPPPPPSAPASRAPGPPPPPAPKGAAPPRPPSALTPKPPFRKNQPGNNDASAKDGSGSGKQKLKPFFWDKVLANPDQSMVWDQIRSGSFQFDEEMIENLFGATNTNKKDQKAGKPSQEARQFIQILDSKKAQNISILLKALNVTIEEVRDALYEGNELPTELVQTLLKMAPTEQEELKLRLYSGDLSQLGPAERFLQVLVNIPFAFKRMDSLLFKKSLQEEVASVKEALATLEVASKELRNSRLFLKLLEAVLKTGNRMNDGTFRGGAQAFKLDTLLKLADVKGADGKTTLLHFVVQEIIRSEGKRAARTAEGKETPIGKSQELTEDFSQVMENYYRSLGLEVVSGLGTELVNVRKAAGLDSDIITGTVSKLGHGLMRTKNFLNTDMKDTDEDSQFHKKLKTFAEDAEKDIMWLLEEEKRIMALVKSTVDYFHGSTGKDEGLRIFVIVRDFLAMLDRACAEVRKSTPKVQSNKDSGKTPSTPGHKKSLSESRPASPTSNSLHKKTLSVTRAPSVDFNDKLFPAIADRRKGEDSSSDDES